MGTLVTQLLELSRTESVSIKKEALDFSRLVDGEALPFESLAFEKGLVLVSQVAQGIRVEGNGEKLRQLVSILLDNAIRHSTEQGEVRLLLTKERGLAKLLVLNRGEPIPAEQRARIFERFYRMDPARSGEEGHYGLGLAIAKAIVTAHKGRLELDCFDGWVQFKAELPSF